MTLSANGIFQRLRVVGLLLLAVALGGCRMLPDEGMSCPASAVIYYGFKGQPRVRYGTYPTSTLGTSFLGGELGAHRYYFPLFEKNGIAYTCRGGHIDIIHLRIAADWTAFLAATSYRHLMKGDTEFSCKLAVDRSRDYVRISYPDNWDRLTRSRRSEISREAALAIGPYLAYTMVTWHEILTWYGFKCIGLPVEYDSAFSWEDGYSNLLGTMVAVRALEDTRHPYNEAVQIAMDEALRELGIQSANVARQASELVKGVWFTGDIPLLVDMKKRNFDIGLDDGYVTPTLVPGVAACPDATPVSYPVPTLDVLDRHGLAITVEIEPHEWERDKILRIVHGDKQEKRIRPDLHFARIMEHIREQAAARYGPEYALQRHAGEQYVTTGE